MPADELASILLSWSVSLRGSISDNHAGLLKSLGLIQEGKLKVTADPTEFNGREAIPEAINYSYEKKTIDKLAVGLVAALAQVAVVAAVMLAVYCVGDASATWMPHIVSKGNKFFNSVTGEEFRLKGIAYYPRPNAGKLYKVDNYDWTADEHEAVWRPHLEVMKDLGVNTIRLYSVDPSKSHDKFMCACSEAGIYVLVGMSAPCAKCAVIDALPPACYPSELFARAQLVYNAFAVYDNTLGFSVGNENNLQKVAGNKDGTATAPCVKAFLRDVRSYASSCATNLRTVPIGLDIADIPPRGTWIQYYDCSVDDDEHTRAEWIGFNPYVECEPKTHAKYVRSDGLRGLMKEYEQVGYSRPLMFGEFGCNLGENTVNGFENQRQFYDAKWMNEEKEMTAQIVGGNVFEFTTEFVHLEKESTVPLEHSKKRDSGKFGIGYFEPDNCDHVKANCTFTPYPEYANLKAAYTTTANSSVKMASFSPKNTKILKCPKTIATKLPPTPVVNYLKCSVRQPVCDGAKANAFEKDASLMVPIGTKKKPSNAADRTKKKVVQDVVTSAAPRALSRSAAACTVFASLAVALWLAA
ncbi:hypothetical protein PybrP1_001621 [[Pythium] brassicae (nom. inval.)]|nr:hypothetical protein PybrP1_001621 [[Pythium] brassicae (nom. inval.)]